VTTLLPILAAGVCFGLGGWLLRHPGPGARMGGVGLWIAAAGPAFLALEQAGVAPGSSTGTMNLSALAGWPLLGLGWGLAQVEEGLAMRLRPFVFVVLLLAAMLDPTSGGLVRPVGAGALLVQAASAARAGAGGDRISAGLGLLGALLPAVLLLPEAPGWGLWLWGAALIPSAFGLARFEAHQRKDRPA